MTSDSCVSADGPVPVLISVKGEPLPDSPLERIELDFARFSNGRWALQLDAAMAARRNPAIILAQGVACLAVAWWAQLSPRSYMERIRGAVFLSPLSVGFGQSAIASDMRLGPDTRLPFRSIVACDPSPVIEQVLKLADSWGSRFVGASGLTGAKTNRGQTTPVEERLISLLGWIEGDASVIPGGQPRGLMLTR